MTIWISVDRFNNDSESSWKEFFSYNSKPPFVGNWDNFPVNVLFSILKFAAPVLVALSGGPVCYLAGSRAVGPPRAPATLLDRKLTDLEAVSTMSGTVFNLNQPKSKQLRKVQDVSY